MTTDMEWDRLIDAQQDEASKAVVGIMVYRKGPVESGDPVYMFSGFTVEIDGMWFLVTAGHVVDENINQLLDKEPETRIELHPFSGETGQGTLINWNTPNRVTSAQLAAAWKDRIEDERALAALENGDVALTVLEDLYVRNLVAVGVQPFVWDQVCFVDDERAAATLSGRTVTTKLFGIPEFTKDTDYEQRVASCWFLRLPVEPWHQDPPFSYWRPTWDNTDLPRDVTGTSGGPIVMLGADKPYLLGIQIAQDRAEGQRRLKAVNAFAFLVFARAFTSNLHANSRG